MNKVPRHISFVLDGNRRWAREHNLPVWEGHLKALDSIEDLVRWSKDAGVEYLTLYLFSTENWGRAQEELAKLFGTVAETAIAKKFPILLELGSRVNIFGSLDRFGDSISSSLIRLRDESATNTAITLNLCVDYGSRAEMLMAVKQIVKDAPELIDESVIGKYLYSAGMPDPDLMIRTGGANRLSNFLLWQQAYTELYFIDKYLPDFTQADFSEALVWYAEQERRFGN